MGVAMRERREFERLCDPLPSVRAFDDRHAELRSVAFSGLKVFPSIESEVVRALCMGAGWAINLVVAEWVIRSRLQRPVRRATGAKYSTP